MVAQRYVKNHSEEQSIEDMKLSSGDRIVQSSIDPAGLAIAEKMRAKIRSNSQAERNSNDTVSLIQVAEGSLEVMQSVGSRLRELAMQSATDTVAPEDRVVIDMEFQQLKNELERITVSTRFNGNYVIKGQGSTYDFQVGVNGNPEENSIRYDMSRILDSSNNFGIGAIDLKTKFSAQNSLPTIDKMMMDINASRAQLGSLSNRMSSIIQNIQISRENMSSSHSKIRDADIAKEAGLKLKAQVAKGAGLEMLKMANDRPGVILKLVS